MPRISLIIHTASADDFLVDQGLPSYFMAVTDNLRFQSMQDFELVYVDTYYEENKSRFAAIATLLPYQVKHVAIHPAHRYWYDRGCCYISAAKNTGILYADGELCISCDDAEFFHVHLLTAYWRHYQAGYQTGRLMHALHKRLKYIRHAEGLLCQPVGGEEYVNDHRWKEMTQGIRVHNYGSLLYAGTSFPLDLALNLNGYNERMDGCKSLEDCEFGIRMGLSGRRFVMDPEGYLFILDHPSYGAAMDIGWNTATLKRPDGMDAVSDSQANPMQPAQRRPIRNFIAVENYGFISCAQELMDLVANKGALSTQHLKIIQRETLKYRQFDPLAEANAENLKTWLGTPTFDLKQQRAELRASPDWRW